MKRFLLIATCLFIGIAVYSQIIGYDASFCGGTLLLQKSAGSVDQTDAVLQLSDRSYVFAGVSVENGTPSLILHKSIENGTPDFNFGLNGQKVINMSPVETVKVVSLVQLSNGNLLVSGNCKSSKQRIFMACLNENGVINSSFGTLGIKYIEEETEALYAYSLKTSDDQFYLCGSKGTENQRILQVMAFNNDGTAISTFGTNGIATATPINGYRFAEAYDLLPTGTDVLVCGVSREYVDETAKGFIVKMDQTGQLVNNFGTNGVLVVDYNEDIWTLNQLKQLSNGNLLVGGKARKGYDNVQYYIKNHDLFFGCYNPQGQAVSGFGTNGQLIVNLTSSDSLHSITCNSSDLLYVTAHKTQLDLYGKLVSRSAALITLDIDGNYLGAYEELNQTEVITSRFLSAFTDLNHRLLITGSSNNKGLVHRFTTEETIESPLSAAPTQGQKVVVYPNPTTNVLFLNHHSHIPVRYEILSMTGRVIKQGLCVNKIEVGKLQNGIYFLRIKIKNQWQSIRFIKK